MPRGVDSNSVMIWLVRIFGAPVIDAQGKHASNISVSAAELRAVSVDGTYTAEIPFAVLLDNGTWQSNMGHPTRPNNPHP